jgi:opacity protein-like surface antigen
LPREKALILFTYKNQITNFMKKLIVTASIIATFAASPAFAKTEGSYLGVNVLRAKADVKTTSSSSTSTDTYFNTKSKDSQTGFGVSYKYAINANDFFIAPGLFFDKIGAETKVSDSTNYYNQNTKITSRYGVKFDAGYDVTEKFAVYVPVGLSMVNYELKTYDYLGSSSLTTKTTGRKSALFYGLGLSFAATNNVLVNLEYNRSSFDLASGGNVALVGNTTLKAKTTLDVLTLGVAYKF